MFILHELLKNCKRLSYSKNSNPKTSVTRTALSKIGSLEPDLILAIQGVRRCGKSTLLNLLGLLDTPGGGQYFLNGEEVSKYAERKRAEVRKKYIGFVFQSFNLIDELTVFENVELPLVYSGISSSERKKKVEEALERMNIGHRRNHFPQQLSGGQQQRVAVARAVVHDPLLILADEPTGNLDSTNGNEVMTLLTALNNAGTTIVMVTHSQHDAEYAHRVIRMLDGSIISEHSNTAKAIL